MTPMTKNNTNRPYPMALSAPLISAMTSHTAPPLKLSGLWLISAHISPNLLFHMSKALRRFSMIQLLSPNVYTSFP